MLRCQLRYNGKVRGQTPEPENAPLPEWPSHSIAANATSHTHRAEALFAAYEIIPLTGDTTSYARRSIPATAGRLPRALR